MKLSNFYLDELGRLEGQADKTAGDKRAIARELLTSTREIIMLAINSEEEGKPITPAKDEMIMDRLDRVYRILNQ